MKIFFLPLALSLAVSNSTPIEQDVLFNAMNDELQRSVHQLKLDNHEKPYYVSYLVADSSKMDISASFGAITDDDVSHTRTIFVDVHSGSYNLDSGHVMGGGFAGMGSGYSDFVLPVDDNYEAIRRKLWLKTDAAYKTSVQNLEKKKAEFAEKNVKERPADWSQEQPLVMIQPKETPNFDRALWKAKVKEWSAIFKTIPQIKSSSVKAEEVHWNRYFVNSEGSKVRVAEAKMTLTVDATALGEDGLELADSLSIGAYDEKHMPADSEIAAKIKAMGQRLTEVMKAKEMETYQGPVVLEGQAAAEFFLKVLAPNISVKRPWDGNNSANAEDPSQNRLGRRILPTFINVVDDPGLKDESGAFLPASGEVDNEGVAMQTVKVVEKGILKNLLSTRLPTLKIKNSNGHAPGNGADAAVSNLTIESTNALDAAALKAKALALAKDEGLDYVLVVRKFNGSAQTPANMFAMFEKYFGKGAIRTDLPLAVDISKLYADGHEELLRGGQFPATTFKVLRDIAATGNDPQRFQVGTESNTVTTPTLIVNDMEVQKLHVDADKPPVVGHPYFDKQVTK